MDSSEVRLSFLIKMGAFKAGEMEGAFFASLRNLKAMQKSALFLSS